MGVIELSEEEIAQIDVERVCPTCGAHENSISISGGYVGNVSFGGDPEGFRFRSSCPNGHTWTGHRPTWMFHRGGAWG